MSDPKAESIWHCSPMGIAVIGGKDGPRPFHPDDLKDTDDL